MFCWCFLEVLVSWVLVLFSMKVVHAVDGGILVRPGRCLSFENLIVLIFNSRELHVSHFNSVQGARRGRVKLCFLVYTLVCTPSASDAESAIASHDGTLMAQKNCSILFFDPAKPGTKKIVK